MLFFLFYSWTRVTFFHRRTGVDRTTVTVTDIIIIIILNHVIITFHFFFFFVFLRMAFLDGWNEGSGRTRLDRPLLQAVVRHTGGSLATSDLISLALSLSACLLVRSFTRSLASYSADHSLLSAAAAARHATS